MYFVIGGGVVGLHTAIALAQRSHRPDVILLEKEQYLGDHTSGRNSQVIHAGFAYPEDSLKARLCVEGNPLSYEWLQKLGVSYQAEGKWIVAFSKEELPALEKTLEIGAHCGVADMREATPEEFANVEPTCRPVAGVVYSGTSGVMDAADYVRGLERYFLSLPDCHILNPCAVTGIDPQKQIIQTDRGDMDYDLVVNAAGLWSDEVYRWSGGQRDLRIKPFKGEYYIWKTGQVKSLVYPVPRRFLPGRGEDKRLVSSMGVHLHRDAGGQLCIGPTQVELDWDQKTNYEIQTPKESFLKEADQFAPVDGPENFEPAYAGNRPKAYENGEALGDFQIFVEGPHLHLIGIDSPGLTAAPAIARYALSLL